jgi:undecaprenyl-diphosphatase
MREAAFVINPDRARHVELLKARCRDGAADHGWAVEFMVGEAGPGLSTLGARLRAYAAGPGERLVFAVGGDGTVRACADAVTGTATALAIVPRGTANLLARSLGIPSGLAAALGTGFAGRDKEVDLPWADGQTFVAMAGLGTDAAVVQATPDTLKDHLGWLGYAVAALPHLTGPAHELSVRIDGGEPLVRRAHCVVVGNVGLLPGGFTLLPGARVDDGVLDIGIISPRSVAGWLLVARRAVGGRHQGGAVEHYRGSSVEVTTEAEVWRQLDGDVIGTGRSLSVGLRPGALRVRVP